MSRLLFRIATDTPTYEADDLAGAGAKATGGRWNARGTAVVYSSTSRALACLETMVHLKAEALPLNRYLVEIEVPDDVWSAARRGSAGAMKVGWDADPPGRVSIDAGMTWIAGGTTAVFIVPSAIIPEEYNVLINPAHPQAATITARKLRRWLYDPRLRALT